MDLRRGRRKPATFPRKNLRPGIAGDDGKHELDHRGEEQYAGALGLGGVVEELIELVGIEGAFEQGAVHDGNGAGLEEALKERTQLHGDNLYCHGE